jgi:hypothetical protein
MPVSVVISTKVNNNFVQEAYKKRFGHERENKLL